MILLCSSLGKSELSGLCKAASKGDANAIMNIVKVRPALLAAVYYVYIQREGLSAGLDEPDNINGCTPLMYAAMADSESAIEMLLNLSVKREQVMTHKNGFISNANRRLILLGEQLCIMPSSLVKQKHLSF